MINYFVSKLVLRMTIINCQKTFDYNKSFNFVWPSLTLSKIQFFKFIALLTYLVYNINVSGLYNEFKKCNFDYILL
jgi:hypothetical protein